MEFPANRYFIMFTEVYFDDMSNMTMKTNNSPARTCEGKNMKTAELVFQSYGKILVFNF